MEEALSNPSLDLHVRTGDKPSLISESPICTGDSSLKSDIRYVLSACESLEREVQARARYDVELQASAPQTANEDGNPSASPSPRSSTSLDATPDERDGTSMNDADKEDACESSHNDADDEDCNSSPSSRYKSLATLALASFPTDAEFLSPVTPSPSPSPSPTLQASRSPSLSPPPGPPHKKRTPLPTHRSPLTPVERPPNGYWTPSSHPGSTGRGAKNTPMCGPCKSGKKGQCFGGLPCDRCVEKGYSRERCEGSLVFKFKGRRRRRTRLEMERDGVVRKSRTTGGRGQKRDGMGRFI